MTELGLNTECQDYSGPINQEAAQDDNLDQQLYDDIFILGVITPIEIKCEDILLELDSPHSFQSTGSDAASNFLQVNKKVLKFQDFDRLYRIIQKHTLLRLDKIYHHETQKRVKIL